MGKHSSNYTGTTLPKEVRPISSWGYVGYSILYAIPVIGWLFLIIFTFSRNRNRRNFARSYWCKLLIFLIIAALCALGYVIFKETINEKVTQYLAEGRAKINELGLDGILTGEQDAEMPTLTDEEQTEEATEPEAFVEAEETEPAADVFAEEPVEEETVDEFAEEEVSEDDIAE